MLGAIKKVCRAQGPDHLEVVQERPEEALVSAPGTGDKAPPVAPVLSRIPAIRFS